LSSSIAIQSDQSRGVDGDMDAPAMLTRKHVPEDVGLRNVG
jgi:hypothetical protein